MVLSVPLVGEVLYEQAREIAVEATADGSGGAVPLNHALREVELARRFVKLAEVADRLRGTEHPQRGRRNRA
jgi:hypothetical protein